MDQATQLHTLDGNASHEANQGVTSLPEVGSQLLFCIDVGEWRPAVVTRVFDEAVGLVVTLDAADSSLPAGAGVVRKTRDDLHGYSLACEGSSIGCFRRL